MSRFDKNWLILRSMSTLSSDTIMKLKFLCSGEGNSVYKDNYDIVTSNGTIKRFRLREDSFEMWSHKSIDKSHIQTVFKAILNEFHCFYIKGDNQKINTYNDVLEILEKRNCKVSLLKAGLEEMDKLYSKFRQDRSNIEFFVKRLKEILFEQKLIILINDYFTIELKTQNMEFISVNKNDNYVDEFILNMTYGEKIKLENKGIEEICR